MSDRPSLTSSNRVDLHQTQECPVAQVRWTSRFQSKPWLRGDVPAFNSDSYMLFLCYHVLFTFILLSSVRCCSVFWPPNCNKPQFKVIFNEKEPCTLREIAPRNLHQPRQSTHGERSITLKNARATTYIRVVRQKKPPAATVLSKS